jgi:hypothetical protein
MTARSIMLGGCGGLRFIIYFLSVFVFKLMLKVHGVNFVGLEEGEKGKGDNTYPSSPP